MMYVCLFYIYYCVCFKSASNLHHLFNQNKFNHSLKKSPRTPSIVLIVFSFTSFEISEGILRNQKRFIGLESFSNRRVNIFDPIWILIVFVSTTLLNDVNNRQS